LSEEFKFTEYMPDYASTTTMQVIQLSDKGYPTALKSIYNPPRHIHVLGDIPALPMVAIVGSRKPTPYGEMVAYKIAADLARSGICVVSGLAYGIDSIVHQATLEAGGKTIAVLGSGLENIYPTAHRALAREIVRSGGALISEYEATAPPLKHHFPARNRIIAGISEATIVPEADAKSGSLITAQLALDENRHVLAVPGPITSARSAGPNNLLKAGASPITSAADIYSILEISQNNSAGKVMSTTELSQSAKQVLSILHAGPSTTEDLSRTSGIAIPTLLSTLTILEMQNYVRSAGGNSWIGLLEI
jgi:DNA processing protein